MKHWMIALVFVDLLVILVGRWLFDFSYWELIMYGKISAITFILIFKKGICYDN